MKEEQARRGAAVTEAAAVLGQDPSQVFKTLVTVGNSGNHDILRGAEESIRV